MRYVTILNIPLRRLKLAILKWLIPLANFSELWPILQKMGNSAESARGIGHYKIATFSRLSGIYFFSWKLHLPFGCILGSGYRKSLNCFEWNCSSKYLHEKLIYTNWIEYTHTLPILICTWVLKNRVWKIKLDELDFCLFQTGILLPV